MKKENLLRLIPLIAVIMLAPCSYGFAADNSKILNLRQSIAVALDKNLVLQAAREEVTASTARKDEAFTGFLPKFSTSYGYTRLNKDPWFPIIGLEPLLPDIRLPAGTKDNFTWAFEVRQPVFTGGAILGTYRASALGVNVANYDEQTRMLDVVQQVQIAYHSVLKTEHILEVDQQAVDQLKAHRKNVKDFFDQEMFTYGHERIRKVMRRCWDLLSGLKMNL